MRYERRDRREGRGERVMLSVMFNALPDKRIDLMTSSTYFVVV